MLSKPNQQGSSGSFSTDGDGYTRPKSTVSTIANDGHELIAYESHCDSTRADEREYAFDSFAESSFGLDYLSKCI